MKITKIKTVHTIETDEDKTYRRFDSGTWMRCGGLNFAQDWELIQNKLFVEKLEALFQEEIGE